MEKNPSSSRQPGNCQNIFQNLPFSTLPHFLCFPVLFGQRASMHNTQLVRIPVVLMVVVVLVVVKLIKFTPYLFSLVSHAAARSTFPTLLGSLGPSFPGGDGCVF